MGSLLSGPGELTGFRGARSTHPGNGTPYAPAADDGKGKPHAFGVDDNACRFLPVGKILFQIVFSMWVTLTEQKLATFS